MPKPRLKNSASPLSLAKWIWPEFFSGDLYNCYAIFRKEFVLARKTKSHRIFITADQSYQLYINGRYVCCGPARGYQESWPYDEVEAAGFLRKGKNLIAVRAYNPGFSNFQYIHQGYAGLIAALDLGDEWLVTDEYWKCRRQPGVNRAAVPSCMPLFPQEHIDLREEPPDWMDEGFVDHSWPLKTAGHVWNGMPWNALEERGIPMLEEKIVRPKSLIGVSSGNCTPGYRDCRDVAKLRSLEPFPHDRVAGKPSRIACLPTGKGRYRSFLIDFGHTVVGSMGFEVSGAAGGEILDTLHIETIDESTRSPHFLPDLHSRIAFGHRLICSPSSFSHVFYQMFGFRYVVVTLRDVKQELSFTPFLRTAFYPFSIEGNFQSSDQVWNQLWEVCAWTQRVCSLDAYVDTPWREQAQWWGDARIQAKNTFFLSGDTRLFRRGLRQIAGLTTPTGLTYGHAPTMSHHCILPDFTLIWFITLWDYYWQTGSLEPFLAHQSVVEGALAYFEAQTDPANGLIKYDDRYWLFLDWVEPDAEGDFFKTGSPTIYNLWLLIALERLAALYRLARLGDRAFALEAWAERLRKALRALVRPGLLSDGVDEKGGLAAADSVHAQTLAMMAGFEPQHDEARLELRLLPFVRGEWLTHPPSTYWCNYVFEILTGEGHGAEVLSFIRRKWSPMIPYGTVWEVFAPEPGVWSHSHAWSAHPLFHLSQILGGIRQSRAGWKQIRFQPLFEGDSCEAVVPAPQGLIRSEWRRESDGIAVELSLPPGISARVVLPGVKCGVIRQSARWKISNAALNGKDILPNR